MFSRGRELPKTELNLDKLPSHRRDWLEVFTLPARQPLKGYIGNCDACIWGTSRGERHNCGRIVADMSAPFTTTPSGTIMTIPDFTPKVVAKPTLPYTPAIIIRRPRKINVVEI
jgi:hypothetical protein